MDHNLVELVEKITGPDRDVDVAIMDAFFKRQKTPGTPYHHWVLGERKYLNGAYYTADINAVVKLVERVLPGCYWMVRGYPEEGGTLYSAYVQMLGGPLHEAEHKAPALALLGAFLRAEGAEYRP